MLWHQAGFKDLSLCCSRCHQTVQSRFLFDERIFDAAYFREMMKESRARAKRKREEVKRLLAGSRSGPLLLMEEPCLDSIPGLQEALDAFISSGGLPLAGFFPNQVFP